MGPASSQDKKIRHTSTIVGDNDDANDGDYSPTKKQRNHLHPSETKLPLSSSFSLYSSPRPRMPLKKPPLKSHFILVPTMDPVSVIRRQFVKSLSTFEVINNEESKEDIDMNTG